MNWKSRVNKASRKVGLWPFFGEQAHNDWIMLGAREHNDDGDLFIGGRLLPKEELGAQVDPMKFGTRNSKLNRRHPDVLPDDDPTNPYYPF